MSANLELAMVLRWRGQEVRTGLSQIQNDLQRTAEAGKSSSDRLVDATRRLEHANATLDRQQRQTGDAGLSTTERLIGGTRQLETAARDLAQQQRQTADAGRSGIGQLNDETRRLISTTSTLTQQQSQVTETGRRGWNELVSASRGADAAGQSVERQYRQTGVVGVNATRQLADGTQSTIQLNSELERQLQRLSQSGQSAIDRLAGSTQRLNTAGQAGAAQYGQLGAAGASAGRQLVDGVQSASQANNALEQQLRRTADSGQSALYGLAGAMQRLDMSGRPIDIPYRLLGAAGAGASRQLVDGAQNASQANNALEQQLRRTADSGQSALYGLAGAMQRLDMSGRPIDTPYRLLGAAGAGASRQLVDGAQNASQANNALEQQLRRTADSGQSGLYGLAGAMQRLDMSGRPIDTPYRRLGATGAEASRQLVNGAQSATQANNALEQQLLRTASNGQSAMYGLAGAVQRLDLFGRPIDLQYRLLNAAGTGAGRQPIDTTPRPSQANAGQGAMYGITGAAARPDLAVQPALVQYRLLGAAGAEAGRLLVDSTLNASRSSSALEQQLRRTADTGQGSLNGLTGANGRLEQSGRPTVQQYGQLGAVGASAARQLVGGLQSANLAGSGLEQQLRRTVATGQNALYGLTGNALGLMQANQSAGLQYQQLGSSGAFAIRQLTDGTHGARLASSGLEQQLQRTGDAGRSALSNLLAGAQRLEIGGRPLDIRYQLPPAIIPPRQGGDTGPAAGPAIGGDDQSIRRTTDPLQNSLNSLLSSTDRLSLAGRGAESQYRQFGAVGTNAVRLLSQGTQGANQANVGLELQLRRMATSGQSAIGGLLGANQRLGSSGLALAQSFQQLGNTGAYAARRLADGTHSAGYASITLGQNLQQASNIGSSGLERLINTTSRLQLTNIVLQRQLLQTGDTTRTTADRLTDSNNEQGRQTTLLIRIYDGLIRRVWELGRLRPGDQIVDSLRRVRAVVEQTTAAFDKMQTAGRLAAGVVAGGTAAKFVLAEPINKTMDYGMRLAGMSNTAFAERDVAGRIEGKKELNQAIELSVRSGGGTRDQAATTLDTLIAAGTMSVKDAMAELPGLTKAATASGADPTQLANIALRSMATFKIDAKDVPRALDMAITAGQEGGFELKDMAKWLPQQMAVARLSGISGMDGFAKIVAANQASVITAGTKDEAGNNLVNLLAKINSQDTAKDAQKLGIDLPGTLAAARSKGMDSIEAFMRLTEVTVAKDKHYQALRADAKTAKGTDARSNLEAQAGILEGSAIGKLIQDRQALMALVGLLNNREYVKDVEKKVKQASGTTDKNYAVIANEVGFKSQQKDQEAEFATYKGFSAFDGPLKSVLDHLIESSREYPNFTAGMKVATTALTALAAAAGAAGLANMLTRGGAAAGAGAATQAGAGILGRIGAATTGAWSRLLTTGAFAAAMPASSFIAAAPAAAAGGVVAAGAAGYGIGSLLYKLIEGTSFSDAIGRSIATAMAAVGNKNAQEALDSERRNQPVEVHVKVSTDSAHISAEVASQQQRQALRR